MQRATLGKSGSEAASQLQGEYHEDDGCHSIYFESLVPQVYHKKSRMTIIGLAGVLFCENEQA